MSHMSELNADELRECLSDVPTRELADELERRFDPNKNEWDPGCVNIHGFRCGDEGVIVKYEPYGPMGLDKKPRTLQYGIYDARIIVVNDDERVETQTNADKKE